MPDFEVSWAGGCPWRPGYCYGSEDGRVLLQSVDGSWRAGPYDVSPSGEAVNGVAFSDGLMAVSTRSDITFLNVPYLGQGQVERAVYNGGAHGVLGIQGGGIVAPLGRRGILVMGPKEERSQRVQVLSSTDDSLYVYKLVSLSDPDRGTILVCACRRGGLAATPLSGVVPESYGKKLQPPGVDFVDVAALGIETFPFAAAGLGLDGSIHFVRDLLTDRTSKMLHFRPLGERAYRILCAEGHVFVLTDRSLYGFVSLAKDFLDGKSSDRLMLNARKMDLEAVDISLTDDRSLLVVMPESVRRIPIQAFMAWDGSVGGKPNTTSNSNSNNSGCPTTTDDELADRGALDPFGEIRAFQGGCLKGTTPDSTPVLGRPPAEALSFPPLNRSGTSASPPRAILGALACRYRLLSIFIGKLNHN